MTIKIQILKVKIGFGKISAFVQSLFNILVAFFPPLFSSHLISSFMKLLL